jgi:hypothetical protein
LSAPEAPEDRVLQRFARRAEDLRKTIAAPPSLFANAEALSGLIDRVRRADLGDVNGPVKNPNVVTGWRRQFQELLSPLPGPSHAQWCAQQVKALIVEARAAREGRA